MIPSTWSLLGTTPWPSVRRMAEGRHRIPADARYLDKLLALLPPRPDVLEPGCGAGVESTGPQALLTGNIDDRRGAAFYCACAAAAWRR